MKVLLMAQHFAPENVSGAILATELAEDLVEQGYQLTFVTCAPNYPKGRVFAGYQNTLFAEEYCNCIRVIRVWSFISKRKNFWDRILSYGTFSLMAFWGGMKASKPEVIFSYSPPLPLGVSAWLLSCFWRVPWVLRIEDLYPDAAVAAGILKNKRAIRFFTRLEKFLYRKATHISVISEGFKDNLAKKGVPAEKLSVTSVWADPKIVHPHRKENMFRSEHDLSGKFVLMYAGALGHTSSLDEVIDAADLLKSEYDVRFVIIGEGVKKETLIRDASNRGLTNISFLPFQPRERFAEMMAAADVSLVTLNPQSSAFSLPSKTFNIMASARPILGITPDESEIAKLIREFKCGVNVQPGDSHKLVKTIRLLKSLSEDRLQQMGNNGRTALESRFARQNCVNSLAAKMYEVANENHRPADTGAL